MHLDNLVKYQQFRLAELKLILNFAVRNVKLSCETMILQIYKCFHIHKFLIFLKNNNG